MEAEYAQERFKEASLKPRWIQGPHLSTLKAFIERKGYDNHCFPPTTFKGAKTRELLVFFTLYHHANGIALCQHEPASR